VGEGDAGFGEADEFDGLLGGDGEGERLGVGQADVFAGEDDDAEKVKLLVDRVVLSSGSISTAKNHRATERPIHLTFQKI
jgi:hypothetical protein